VYGFPKDEALKTAIASFTDYLTDHDMDIILVVFDEESFVLSGKVFSDIDEFIDENYVDEQIDEEYGSRLAYDTLAGGLDEGISERRGRVEPVSYLGRLELQKLESVDMLLTSDAESDGGEAPGETFIGVSPQMEVSLDYRISHVSDTWQQSLLHIIDEKGYKDTEVYKRANVDRKLFSKIRSNPAYQPKKITAVAFALALRLNLDETRDLLSRAGYALSPSSKFDLIVEYFIEHEVYDTYTINLALFKHEQPILGE
jgi:hypothetical protein